MYFTERQALSTIRPTIQELVGLRKVTGEVV
jgi:hypothetical protein